MIKREGPACSVLCDGREFKFKQGEALEVPDHLADQLLREDRLRMAKEPGAKPHWSGMSPPKKSAPKKPADEAKAEENER